ncbi:metal ABC transporter ATP-binding protein [Eubacteriales bacterium KG127]
MALMTCHNLSFSYEGKIVVKNLNFELNKGDYLCIVGENGAGKSTLAKGLLRLKSPSQGEIILGDGLKPAEIGYLPQQTPAQRDFPGSVFEIVLSGRLNKRGIKPFYSPTDKKVALKNMENLGILHIRNACYGQLSGGQQQRVLLARALCSTDKVILLDEPVTGLDPLMTQNMYKLINKLNAELGITIIMISHDIHGAIEYGSHILHLSTNQLFYGKTHDYMGTDLGKLFIGLPSSEGGL